MSELKNVTWPVAEIDHKSIKYILALFPLISLLSRVYSQQVFLDKFTFSCVRSTSFPWQVYLLVCTVNKFSLTSLLSRVYSQQVSLDKFCYSCECCSIFISRQGCHLLPKSYNYFLLNLVHLSSHLGGRTREQIFPDQKLTLELTCQWNKVIATYFLNIFIESPPVFWISLNNIFLKGAVHAP
jgi:hypothetical protein